MPQSSGTTPTPQINMALLKAAIKLNTLLLASVSGLLGGLLLFTITFLSLNKGMPYPGHYLNLLGVFLPGYNVSPAGAWIGLFWGAVVGALIGALFYRIYARTIETQVSNYLRQGRSSKDLMTSVMKIDGNSLGLALGAIVAIGLLISTNWLVFRGTANESFNAALFSNYLPGYSVSTAGSFVGAIEIFIIVYLLCLLFGWVYNKIAVLRGGDPQ
ncbi:MAG: hypothetical protein V3V50_02545 [Gammaproteobacteria bacterium]